MSDYWIQTRSGMRVDLLNPDPATIKIEDIAFHLAYINRFVGAVGAYSVAQHSCYVCNFGDDELALECLLHDAAEAYLHDITTQLKKIIKLESNVYTDLTNEMERVIAYRFGLRISPETKTKIKEIDLRVFLTEVRDLYKHNNCWVSELALNYKPYNFHISIYPPKININNFMMTYDRFRRD